jgi:UDP-N-acetyl-D-glucosamine dehydrogenase
LTDSATSKDVGVYERFYDNLGLSQVTPLAEGSEAPLLAFIGMGYVGLPTALAARERGARTLGIDSSAARLKAIRAQRVDLVPADRAALARVLGSTDFELTSESRRVAEAEAVFICVPTPVDEHRNPDLRALRAACSTVVDFARPGQTIILTSTSYPGTTRELLVEPLAERGLVAGQDVFVAFSPERIDPGNQTPYADIPRVVGGTTAACTDRAAAYLAHVTNRVETVSSIESAEMTKLLENSFRAVNIAFVNEFADACEALGLNAREIVDAASTKPYGFMPFYPGTGVGGHCIPCDPHYLLWELRSRNAPAPILTESMEAIAARPFVVVDALSRRLSAEGRGLASARVMVVGIAYKPGVEDVRESPGERIVHELIRRGADVDYFDPLVPSLHLDEQSILLSVLQPDAAAYDAVIVSTMHPEINYGWLLGARILVDPSGRVGVAGALAPTGAPDADDGNARRLRNVAEDRVALRVDG